MNFKLNLKTSRGWIPAFLCLIAFAAALAWAAARPLNSPTQSHLAPLMPSGAALFIEAKDFASLLDEWNSSPEKKQWLKSDDFEVFSRSRVLLRLAEAQGQFAAAAGVPPDMPFLSRAAGKESALGFYDIGKLEFLYITRLPSSSAMQSTLWQARAKFDSRTAAGTPFFVHTDSQSGRVVAFAVAGDYLLVATREDLLAGSLELIAGGNGPKISDEDWYTQSVGAAGEPGDLRMVLNMEKIVAAPHFRSYWVQGNVAEMRQYRAAVSDLYRSGSTYREERVLFRKPASPEPANPDAVKPESAQPIQPVQRAAATPEGTQAVADLLRLVPDDAGVYRVVANPTADVALALLQTRILAPQISSAPAGNLAPSVNLTGGEVGSSTDLETLIDQPPAVRAVAEDGTTALKKALDAANIQGILVLSSTHTNPQTPFVEIRTGIALAAASDWDAPSVYAAIANVIAQPNTTQQLGATWKPAGAAPNTFMELDGLLPLRVSIRGKILIASNSAETIAALLPRLSTRATLPPASFAAGFRDSAERQNFIRLTSALDRTAPPDSDPYNAVAQQPSPGIVPANQQMQIWTPAQPTGAPEFFSGNLASLSRVFSTLDSETVVIRDSDGKTFQTVTYNWK
jgi:hypothetical protein